MNKDILELGRADVMAWCPAKVDAWRQRQKRPNAYYYRFTDPGVRPRMGAWSPGEQRRFRERIEEMVADGYELESAWGIFARAIPGRVGYQCAARYRALQKSGELPPSTKADEKKQRPRLPPETLNLEAWQSEVAQAAAKRIDEWVRELVTTRASTSQGAPVTPPVAVGLLKSGTVSPKKRPLADRLADNADDDDFDVPVKRTNRPTAVPLSPISPETAAARQQDQTDVSKTPEREQKHLITTIAKTPPAEGSTAIEAVKVTPLTKVPAARTLFSFFSPKSSELPTPDKTNRSPQWTSEPVAQDIVKRRLQRPTAPTEADDDFVRSNAPQRQVHLGAFWAGVPAPVADTPEFKLTFSRVPPYPLPLTWASVIAPAPPSNVVPEESLYIEDDGLHRPGLVDRLGLTGSGHYQGVLVDPPWGELGMDAVLSMLANVLSDSFQPSGMAFVWVPKPLLARLISAMAAMNYLVVENLIWVCKESDNRMRACSGRRVGDGAEGPEPLTNCIKRTLVFFRRFRKGAELELRHQRSADVVIDFRWPTTTWTQGHGLERKPDRVYETIETLLPNAVFCKERREGRLLELWARRGAARRNWTSVYDSSSN